MNWVTFILFAYIALVLEVSCRGALAIHSLGGISPSFIAPLLAGIALGAPRLHVIWAALILGLILDLSMPFSQSNGAELYIPGPHALGMIIVAWLITQLRSSVFRDRVMTVAALTFGIVLLSGLVVLAIYRVRGTFPNGGRYFITGSMGGDAIHTLGNAVYSMVLAIPLGWVVLRCQPLWGFVQHMPRVGSAVR